MQNSAALPKHHPFCAYIHTEARKKAGVSTISAEALKKARRLAQLGEKAGAGGGSGKEGLFKYVQRAGASIGPSSAKTGGAAAAGAGAAPGFASSSSSAKGKEKEGEGEQKEEGKMIPFVLGQDGYCFARTQKPNGRLQSGLNTHMIYWTKSGGRFEQDLESQLNDLMANPSSIAAASSSSSSALRRPLATPLTSGGTRPLSRYVLSTQAHSLVFLSMFF